MMSGYHFWLCTARGVLNSKSGVYRSFRKCGLMSSDKISSFSIVEYGWFVVSPTLFHRVKTLSSWFPKSDLQAKIYEHSFVANRQTTFIIKGLHFPKPKTAKLKLGDAFFRFQKSSYSFIALCLKLEHTLASILQVYS